MNNIRMSTIPFLLLLSVGYAYPSEEPAAKPVSSEQTGKESAEEPKTPVEGLWLTAKQRELLLKRWAEDISIQFDLDATQKDKVRDGVVKRWTGFLDDNREDIQPLVNEFIEMRLELEPPSKERVQEWADKALPVFDGFREQIRQGQSEFREMLNFRQRAKFEIEALGFEAGLKLAESRLKQWKEGEFKVDDLWEPPRAERRRRRAEREAKEKEAEVKQAEPDDQIALEVKRWEEFVADFVKKYQFDQGQTDAAASCLNEIKGRALAHRDRRKDDITRLEQKINTPSDTKEEIDDLKKQLAELYGPVDDMFKELRGRLEQIPTAAQREQAGKIENTEKKG